MDCLRCPIHASPVEAVSLMISEPTWVVCAVESMRHRGSSFVDDFRVARDSVSLMISEAPWTVCAVQSTRRLRESPLEAVSLMISEALGAVSAIESIRH